ncbi:Helicase conserved C-terminal domain containing protein, related [Eimeria mitis]|uniref:Helicase conserved C-terminal domain containing protein, related n=1 Tax=Eimeria mitis TaxID=44415 RepID=U6KCZ5_9EIME|nr:Helicase conserved C-terminal domain containing protein, related [Eimeria mitis]CDJ34122.1 Helicase conserved C-terminal domain containing protein, related [Eimeria mitis]
MVFRLSRGVCKPGIARYQRFELGSTARQQQRWSQQRQQQPKWHQQQVLRNVHRQNVLMSTEAVLRLNLQQPEVPAGTSIRSSNDGSSRGEGSSCSRSCYSSLHQGPAAAFQATFSRPRRCSAVHLETVSSAAVGGRLLQRASTSSAAAVSVLDSSSSGLCRCCVSCRRDGRKVIFHDLAVTTSHRGVSQITHLLVQQRQQRQGQQQQQEGSLWWEDADTEGQIYASATSSACVKLYRTSVQEQEQQQQQHQQKKQQHHHNADGVGATERPGWNLAKAADAAGTAAAVASPDHTTRQPKISAPPKAAAAGAKAAGLATREVSLFLLSTPLTSEERHALVSLWRRLSSAHSLLKLPHGASAGPPLAAFLEARWGLPASLLSAVHTQRAFFRWLYSALQRHQGQQYLRVQQESHQQQQLQQQEQECAHQPQQHHETSNLDKLQAEAFNDLLRSIRGQFDLHEAAEARRAKQQQQQQSYERLQALLEQWKRAVRGFEEKDLLNSTYQLILEVCAAVDGPPGAPPGTPGSLKDPTASPLLPPAAGPLLALYRIYLARGGVSAVISYKNILKLVDLTAPELWFPVARQQQRRVSLSLGPPNSGKTRGALLRKKGVKCSLITGPLKIIDTEATHVCSTVEAAPLDKDFSVGVIDEVQLLADPQRGPAWTRAFLGLRARTHLPLRMLLLALLVPSLA